jgi:hypothetical protein
MIFAPLRRHGLKITHPAHLIFDHVRRQKDLGNGRNFDLNPVLWIDQTAFNHRGRRWVIAKRCRQNSVARFEFKPIRQHVRHAHNFLHAASRFLKRFLYDPQRIVALSNDIIALPDCTRNMNKATRNNSPAIPDLFLEFTTRRNTFHISSLNAKRQAIMACPMS